MCISDWSSDVCSSDLRMTRLALESLREVARRFPGTAFARDARIKLDLTHDHLAGKQMQIGRYYEKRGEYLAAINRFRTVVEEYQTTTRSEERRVGKECVSTCRSRG